MNHELEQLRVKDRKRPQGLRPISSLTEIQLGYLREKLEAERFLGAVPEDGEDGSQAASPEANRK